MKIAFSPEIWLGQSVGGVSRYFVELMSGVETAGHVLMRPLLLHRNEFLSGSTMKKNSVKLRFPHKKLVSLASEFNRNQFDRSLKTVKPDLIHETYYPTVPNAAGNIPVVTTIHDFIAEKNRAEVHRNPAEVQSKANSIRRAAAILCVSETTKADLEERFPEARGRAVVIPLGVNAGFFSPEETAHAFHQRPFLLYVGQRSGHKNFLTLLEAYGRSAEVQRDFDLVLFGGGKLTREETEAVSAHQIPPGKVIQTGGDDNKLAKLYATATAFVFPSLQEGFGLPLIEAGASMCPIFASDIPVMREVTGGQAIFFDPTKSEDLMSKLQAFLFDQEALRSFGTQARINAEKFTWDQTVSQTMHVYEKLLNHERLGP